MKSTDIFTPTSFPKYTLVEDNLEEKIRKKFEFEINTKGTIISLSGPSKSGKTVFIESSIYRDNLIKIGGSGINSSDILWSKILAVSKISTIDKVTTTSSTSKGIGGEVSGGSDLFVAKTEGKVSTEMNHERASSTEEKVKSDLLDLIISTFRNSSKVIFLDDFHYISKEAQIQIAQDIKQAAEAGVKFIIASVPYHSEDAIRANSDLRGRVCEINFSYWEKESLKEIANIGFEKLNIDISNEIIDKLAEEASGSPQLMQRLCLSLCQENNIINSFENKTSIDVDDQIFKTICESSLSSVNYKSIVGKMEDGARTRGTVRKNYLLMNNKIGDVYTIILIALAQDPPELTIKYDNLLSRINKICNSETSPAGSSVIGACEKIAEIANGIQPLILEWDSEAGTLIIEDPYLLFYIRWSGLFNID